MGEIILIAVLSFIAGGFVGIVTVAGLVASRKG